MKKIIIIGGGISGLSSAWKLSEKGYKVDVVESDTSIGDLAKSIKVENYYFDIGRQGQFYYGDIDQMIRVGFDAADKIIHD